MSQSKPVITPEAKALWTKIDVHMSPLVDFHEWDKEWDDVYSSAMPMIRELELMGYVYAIDEPIRPVTTLHYVKDRNQILFVSMDVQQTRNMAEIAKRWGHEHVRIESKVISL